MTPENLARAKALFEGRVWWPQAGPQQACIQSQAHITLYGGAAGGGKSDALLGMAMTEHQHSIIYRREATQLQGMIQRMTEILGNRDGYNGSDKIWKLKDGKIIEFGSCPNPGDETRYQGRPHDFIGFDEAANFLESQFRFLCGWCRTTDPKQRKRIVLASNPPTGVEGSWLIRYFAPWLDPNYPNPAKPGELRWFAMVGGVEKEIEGSTGESFMHNGEEIKPHSRTFIPAKVADNAYLMGTDYVTTLQALPEPLRSQMLYGDFTNGQDDDSFQVIPSAWIREAMARWKPNPDLDCFTLTALGVDPSRGGKDETVIAARHGWHFDKLKTFPGREMTKGSKVAAQVMKVVNDGDPLIFVDSVGIGTSVVDILDSHYPNLTVAVNGAERPEDSHDSTGHIKYANKRSENWWHLRELLSPDTPYKIALPNDTQLMQDLSAPHYRLEARGIYVDKKETIEKRIGRSPDRGDAVVYAACKVPRLRLK